MNTESKKTELANTKSQQLKIPQILLVEDDEILQRVYSTFLKDFLGCKVIVAPNGQTALDLFDKCNLVLLDIGLPDIDGRCVCKIIRKIKSKKELPIIALTAFCLDEIKKECFKVGMNAFVTKPIEPEELHKLLSHWLPSHDIPFLIQ